MYSQACPPLIPIDILLPGSWGITMQVKVTKEKGVEGKGVGEDVQRSK